MHNVHDSQMTMQLTSEFRISQACSKGYATTHRWCRGRHHRWGCRGCEQGVDEVGVCAKVLSKAVSDVEYWMGRLLNLKGNNPTGALNPRTRAWVELTNACMCIGPSNAWVCWTLEHTLGNVCILYVRTCRGILHVHVRQGQRGSVYGWLLPCKVLRHWVCLDWGRRYGWTRRSGFLECQAGGCWTRHGAFGFMLGSSKNMSWLVKITGLKETLHTVQVRITLSTMCECVRHGMGVSIVGPKECQGQKSSKIWSNVHT